MTSTIKLGRIAGVEVGINWSWLLIFGLLVWSLADGVFPTTNPGLTDATYWAMGAIAVTLFFGALLLHELGHARRAIREGMEIDGITLWIFGGVARFKGAFPSAAAEFRVAAAGPIVTLVIGGAMLLFALLAPLPGAIDGVCFWLGYVNLVVLVFNLVPALPLDGGRILHAYLWARHGDAVAATQTGTAIGRVFGQALIALGIVALLFGGGVGGLWFVLIGWFLMAASQAERLHAETHHALSGVVVGDVMARNPVIARPDMTLSQFMDECFFPTHHVAYPVVDGELPVGLLSFRAALARPRDQWDELRVADAMVGLPDVERFGVDTPLEDAMDRFALGGTNRALVIRNERLVGMVSLTDVVRVAEARRDIASSPARSPQPAAA
jgi:Zn-dependent protease/CBS domain-containing protein